MASRVKIGLLVLLTTAVAGLSLAGMPAETAAQAATVQRADTLERLAVALTERFVDPDVGKKYAAMLRANAAAKKYDAITDDAAFARAVTDDLQAVAFDGHLKVLPTAAVQAITSQRGPITASKTVEATARLTPEIAYIRLGDFLGRPEAQGEIERWLDSSRDAKTLIFDVRTHRGGGLSEMDVIFSRIFNKSQVLVGMDTRSNVRGPMEVGPMLREAAAPDGVNRREHIVVPGAENPLQKAKIFVLSSGRTASAGEHFVLAMKRTGRATVIGDTTVGAGNFGGGVPIGNGFAAWIPVGRTFDPDTNKGWDYAGVAPNVAVPAAQALTEALVRSGVARAEAERLSAANGPAADRITSLRKAPASVAGI